MRRVVVKLTVAALLFSGLIAALGGHPEVFSDGGAVVLHDDEPHSEEQLDQDDGDHCCHSTAHFVGLHATDPMPAPMGRRESVAVSAPTGQRRGHAPPTKPPTA